MVKKDEEMPEGKPSMDLYQEIREIKEAIKALAQHLATKQDGEEKPYKKPEEYKEEDEKKPEDEKKVEHMDDEEEEKEDEEEEEKADEEDDEEKDDEKKPEDEMEKEGEGEKVKLPLAEAERVQQKVVKPEKDEVVVTEKKLSRLVDKKVRELLKSGNITKSVASRPIVKDDKAISDEPAYALIQQAATGKMNMADVNREVKKMVSTNELDRANRIRTFIKGGAV